MDEPRNPRFSTLASGNTEADTFTLRDLFAALAMAGLLGGDWGTAPAEDVANCAYEVADVMLTRRMK
jgi:hypothetical protein